MNNNIIQKTTKDFLNNIIEISEDHSLLTTIDENVIDLNKKHSIRKWIRENTTLHQKYPRRKYVELSIQIDSQIRKCLDKLHHTQICQRLKKLKKQHAEFLRQARNGRRLQK